MPQRRGYLFNHLNPAAAFMLLATLHISAVVFLSNINDKDCIPTKNLSGYVTYHTGQSLLYNVRIRKRKPAQKTGFSRGTVLTFFKLISSAKTQINPYPEYIFSRHNKDIWKYIISRPPPEFQFCI